MVDDEHIDEEDEGSEDSGNDELEDEAGPSEKIVKPLTAESLAKFEAAQEKTGIIYISRIPPGMRPSKVRHLMSQYGEIGRVYLQQEGQLSSFILF
jgi:ESF2/ABP1 family protein